MGRYSEKIQAHVANINRLHKLMGTEFGQTKHPYELNLSSYQPGDRRIYIVYENNTRDIIRGYGREVEMALNAVAVNLSAVAQMNVARGIAVMERELEQEEAEKAKNRFLRKVYLPSK